MTGPPSRDGAQLHTFDVFDTLLCRVVASPSDVFAIAGRLAQQRGLVQVSPVVFARSRSAAEQRAWHRHGRDGGVTLAVVYEELGAVLGPRAPVQQLVDLELEVERRVLRPRHGLSVHAPRTAIVSDMYLPEATVRGWLLDDGLIDPATPVYVSGPRSASKASGSLFRLVAEEQGVELPTIVHTGNDRSTDVAVPTRLGVQVQPSVEGNLNRYERRTAAADGVAGGLASLLAGSARVARVSGASTTSSVIRDVACSVGAPLLIAYTIWLLQQAAARGVDRLYFLARDGQVLLELARVLAPVLGVTVDLRYLHASRQAVNVAALGRWPTANRAWLWTHLDEATPREALTRVGVSLGLLETLANGRWHAHADRRLGRDESTALIDALAASGAVEESAAAAWPLLRDHLAQEGVLDDVHVGFVDLGGVGSQLEALVRTRAAVAEERGGTARSWTALAYRSAGPAALEDTDPLVAGTAWLYDDRVGRGVSGFRGLVTLLELFSRADHGTVLGYERRDRRVEPVLEDGGVDAAGEWGLETLRAAIVDTAHEVARCLDLVDAAADVREPVLAGARLFWREPSTDEARVFGAFPFETSRTVDVDVQGLVVRLSAADALRRLWTRRWPLPWFAWPAGSIATSPLSTRVVHAAVEPVRRTLATGVRRFRRTRYGSALRRR